MFDAHRLRESWKTAAAHGDQLLLFFYSTLFLTHPESRGMFPVGMAAQRDRFFTALGTIVSRADRMEELMPVLEQLGRNHRRLDLRAGHYQAVRTALLTTLAHFLCPLWTDELARDWEAAYDRVAHTMQQAAGRDDGPRWWDAEVIGHERRTLDVAVITVRPSSRLDFLPGQNLTVETHLRSRMWRRFSPANAPRPDGSIELHVRMVPGGAVSSALVHGIQVGDVVRCGAPAGDRLTLAPGLDRPLLLIAGGTGLAPLKALAEQVAAEGAAHHRPPVTLVHGVRTEHDLYDWPALESLARTQHRWLTVIPAYSEVSVQPQVSGTAVEVALRLGRLTDHEVYVCGSDDMVRGTVERLTQAGTSRERIRFEPFPGSGEEALGVPGRRKHVRP
ncbi:FAD-binding oxidoreductase [Streptomyces sp. NPDC001288]|uniref:FAD-binding oxidoreductase n=1 Tax=unclassified Streptomyces TaxID=2593676 RepID=UPI00331B3117